MQTPKRKSEELKRSGGRDEDHYLTADAIRKLRDEIEIIERAHRPKAVEDLTRAREMGDLSENAAYHEAKGRLMRLDGRVFSLKEKLKHAVLIEPGTAPTGRIGIGSTVVIAADGKRRVYQILGSQETDPSSGRISHLSPLGSALMGHAAGDEVAVKAQDREIVYRVEEVK
jgi:transcription elongation factor GreA